MVCPRIHGAGKAAGVTASLNAGVALEPNTIDEVFGTPNAWLVKSPVVVISDYLTRHHREDRALIQPLVDFRMSVAEGKAAGSVVKRGRRI